MWLSHIELDVHLFNFCSSFINRYRAAALVRSSCFQLQRPEQQEKKTGRRLLVCCLRVVMRAPTTMRQTQKWIMCPGVAAAHGTYSATGVHRRHCADSLPGVPGAVAAPNTEK